jgi:hypothetical protein
VRSSALAVLTTKIRQTILHSITGIILVAVAGDIMDMDKGECSISRILALRHRRCRENNNYALKSFPEFPLKQKFCRSDEQQNGDELPGTRCRPAAHSIRVRFYGLKPLRSG